MESKTDILCTALKTQKFSSVRLPTQGTLKDGF
jgi:hypothetical protein